MVKLVNWLEIKLNWRWEITKWILSIGYTAFLVWLGHRFGADEEIDEFPRALY
ncbi:MAG: hypothetical protein JSV27_04230 [Candidatus Bathyarchaeota archaeon]|nr:MAG: hypothetical protein JSV27_04230 [Candidatus Bathyarchaeota archaeon]